MIDLIKLPEIIYDLRARDGTWCTLQYPNHPKGCPNFPDCPAKHTDFKLMEKMDKQARNVNGDSVHYTWFAVIEVFNLLEHIRKMKLAHPKWTERQCKNPLYWQATVRKTLRAKAERYRREIAIEPKTGLCFGWATQLLEIPEAHGINVFATMEKVGVTLQRNPSYVQKIMLIAIPSIVSK